MIHYYLHMWQNFQVADINNINTTSFFSSKNYWIFSHIFSYAKASISSPEVPIEFVKYKKNGRNSGQKFFIKSGFPNYHLLVNLCNVLA